ncbi:response regulator transcription factor [Oceanispirochaeta sp.]|jgi:DNA-binding response OmpR family regulator|uniref:response regulator transcription factor n=1 Tax=Oceanispirochaeta sp. TaxID=2035350 RepID=UPI002622ABE9|nr:response regulator transcription factor [Oceanispirochaeta sp.]MDA3955970.1 response regulator transcription factor [Oceanispirochaeta sp.]
MKGRLLIVDDEPQLTGLLEYLLKDEGYETSCAASGELALVLAEKDHFDLILLDINLPGMSGMEVCRRLGASAPPVIFLSCRDDDSDVVGGLESGAEDYITKPFNHRELILRIEKVLRHTSATSVIRCGDLEIDIQDERVRCRGSLIHLSPIEMSLIKCLAASQGRIVSWQELIERVWGYHDWEGGHDIVKVTIGRIRKKIETQPGCPQYLHNEWGKGYRLCFKNFPVEP